MTGLTTGYNARGELCMWSRYRGWELVAGTRSTYGVADDRTCTMHTLTYQFVCAVTSRLYLSAGRWQARGSPIVYPIEKMLCLLRFLIDSYRLLDDRNS